MIRKRSADKGKKALLPWLLATGLSTAVCSGQLHAEGSESETGLAGGTGSRLLISGGVTGVDGAAGGGLTPWALISGYGSKEQINGTVNTQFLDTGSYQLRAFGATVGFYDTVELSVQTQRLDLAKRTVSNVFNLLTGGAINAAPGTHISQTTVGAKWRINDDIIFGSSPWMPALAVGVQYKKNHDFNRSIGLFDGSVPLPNQGVPAILGAKDDSGVDFYLSASKFLLGAAAGNNVLLSTTARATKANTLGFLGFGTANDDSYKLEWEGSIVLNTTANLVFGVEWRTQSDRLGGVAQEQTMKDVFVAYFPNKSWSATAAWVDLGNLPLESQAEGFYLSLTANF